MKDPWRKQEEIKRLLESNKNKKTAYQNFRDRLRQREGHLQLQVFIILHKKEKKDAYLHNNMGQNTVHETTSI